MTYGNCGECLYRDRCAPVDNCQHFTPLLEDILIDDYIEQERVAYYAEWFQYVGEYD